MEQITFHMLFLKIEYNKDLYYEVDTRVKWVQVWIKSYASYDQKAR